VREGRVVPATHVWTGLAGNGLWSTAGNWDVGAPTAAEGTRATDDVILIFPAVANEATTQDIANLIVDQIQIQSYTNYSIQVAQRLTLRQGADPKHPTLPQFSSTFPSITKISGGTITTFDDPIRGGQSAVLQVEGVLTISSILAGGGADSGYVKTDTGALYLLGDNTYTGTTTVSSGLFHVEGAQAGSAVSVATGAMLGGGGNIGAITTTAGAIVAPGLYTAPSPITLTANGDANLTGSRLGLIVYPGAGVSDKLIVRQGTVTLTGTTLDVRSGTITGAPVGQSITLIDNQGFNPIVGTFAGLPSGSTVRVDAQDFRIRYDGGDGNDVVLTALTAVTSPTPTNGTPGTTARPIHLTAVLFTKDVGKKATFIRVTSSAGGTPKVIRSPFQKPAYKGISVRAIDTNGDGSDDSIVVTGKKRRKTGSVNIRIG
jgi:autotransporter-associated beta strand protein